MPRSVASIRACAVLGVAWALAARASAHDPPHGRALLWTSSAVDAAPAVVVSNRGLVFADEAAGATAFSLRCYDAYGGGISEAPGVFFDAQGALTIGVFNAVRATSDRACTLQASDGLPAGVESLSVALQDVGAPQRLFVASRTFMQAALYVSDDYGRSWSTRFQNRADDYFHALLAAPSEAQRLYAAGRRADRVNQKLIYFSAVSLDSGASWQDHVLPAEIIPFAVHPHEADVVFAYEPTNVLETEYRVLRSDDRGAMFEPVLGGVPQPTALVAGADAATLWLGVGAAGGLYRSSDGGRLFERVLADSVQSVTCLAYRQSRLWLCANMAPNTNGVWFSDDQGATFQKWMEFADVRRPVTCAQADAPAVCDLAWHDFDIELHPRLPDAGVDASAGDDAATPPEADASDAPFVPTDASFPELDAGTSAPVARKRDSGCQTLGAPGAPPLWLAWLALAALAARRR